MHPTNPCQPNPCGPNAQCKAVGNAPSCSCLPDFTGTPPNCRPECVSNSECASHLACINQKCKDPCPGSCGLNADCRAVSHTPNCICLPGFVGNPFIQCSLKVEEPLQERPTPCVPSPCGANALCREQNGAGACQCIQEYIGNPYEGCRPECTLSSDCPSNKACISNKCKDPCPGACGNNAQCQPINHLPSCTCIVGYTGDPFRHCSIIAQEPVVQEPSNPCQPSPCGPNSQCREINEQAVCSCLPDYIGSPPGCRPECVVSSECPFDKACVNQKCADPCVGICGLNAKCQVINHSPICSCSSGFTGDPFSRCYTIPAPPVEQDIPIIRNPCVPSPCGPNSQCHDISGLPSCSCLVNYIGSPPNCRPECTINSECPTNQACIREKCRDPCPGLCGTGAQCSTFNHIPACVCLEGYTGDPFSYCQLKIPEPVVEQDPCNPSPCGPNAQCNAGTCTCLPEYQGNPYVGCRPECLLNNDCARDKACIRQKCVDPCPGTCGQNAECSVINHIPTCTCLIGYQGNAFVGCQQIPPELPQNPCNPSPCGPNSQCREINGQAVCSCVPGFIGSPPTCRPECVSSNECALDKACQNQKCINPCPGTCGLNALCQVVNHNPICSCPNRYSGDPFTRCVPIVEEPVITPEPCNPSPCGPNAQCKDINGSPSCSCLPQFVGQPPNCKPECVSNSECANHLACISQKCQDPCPGTCGENAECRVVSHSPNCICIQGYAGNPFVRCNIIEAPKPFEQINPCYPSPCGPNAICREQNNAGSCTCVQDYIGNPYEGCRPECTLNSDCPAHRACIRNKCVDPCPGTCGQNAECQVINHLPSCNCITGYTGDPFRYCTVIQQQLPLEEPTRNPCQPSPCGPNSQCREVNNQAVCSCLPTYVGSPPGCRPECTVSSECPQNQACVNQKCADPCPGTCGLSAQCNVINHSPICSCLPGFTGNPFTRCYSIPPSPPEPTQPVISNPCVPSPCGPYSICQDINGAPSCSCISTYIGNPPNCRPECTINSECVSRLACIREKCSDPCPGSCGISAQCSVINHIPICSCLDGYTGDPFSNCYPKPAPPPTPVEVDKCNPSPCGPNARCSDGVCTCIPEYQGDPYLGCRPECVLNTDCSRDMACINQKCRNPCPGTCGQNAECAVINHIPTCTCLQGYTGEPFVLCNRIPPEIPKNTCNPSPCGPNSQCREINGQAVCSCVPGYIGSPPTCRPECITSTECPLNQACLNQKCIDPCPGTCGLNALCQVINHNPVCSCPPRQTGDPFIRCLPIREEPVIVPTNPCKPSPCGPNSQCRDVNGSPSCSCLSEFIGLPPNCKPECVSNTECLSHLACINQKCRDPCPGICGQNAECRVVSHTPNCVCLPGYNGNPFQRCAIAEVPRPEPEPTNPCLPSPCGSNAICKEQGGAGSCTCIPEYIGNPYEGCRPECSLNSDCSSNKACINSKCADPCPGTCGSNAQCQVINHLPSCSCAPGYTGDPFRLCYRIPETVQPISIPTNPCEPSPCGPNSQCREINGQGVCSCLPGYIGSPPGCRPECTVSSECSQNKACVNQKCVDPCPGTCGINAQCSVVNHSPICSCSLGYTGDPFTRCYTIPLEQPTEAPIVITNPCVPSPCGPNSQCRDIGGNPSCSCLPQYVSAPPNCRPECTVSSECPSNLACINEQCRDPCPGSCGIQATCQVRNHGPICICPPGYVGDAFVACVLKPLPPPEIPDPCVPSPCGANARCDNGTCSCYPEYQGDPYRECRPECVINTDCPRNSACINQKCKDPCPGICGQNAECSVFNHIPVCSCLQGYTGDAFVLCNRVTSTPPPSNPCNPSPCGPNSQCRNINNQAICACLAGYIGAPPSCRPECVSSTECFLNKACVNQKCIDPCPGSCGINTVCQVVNHNPICSCAPKYSGDPFVACRIVAVEERLPQRPPAINPCVPSPCGPNAQCEPTPSGTAKCSCLSNYLGAPPNCRPECLVNADCLSSLACINQKCRDPCPGSCGLNARCLVVNHIPNCLCIEDYVGDPFTRCTPKPPPVLPSKDPCYPSPCGPNAHCRTENDYAICECAPEYHGNPYQGCRPECLSNSDCAANTACINNKCRDPCPGTCGVNAVCTVTNHRPACTCQQGYAGDAFRYCSLVVVEIPKDPCNPSPCGINTVCRTSKDTAICECLPGFFGNANIGGCRPECTISSDCPRNQACVNTKCVDPCPGVCGFKADCNVINHSPVCSCPQPLVGDPFTLCTEPVVKAPEDPCNPSPCKVNGQCRVVNDAATCIYPECVINPDCPRDKACYSQKCQDPCTGACGLNAICQVVNHQSVCTCPPGFTGTPEVQCKYVPPEQPRPKPECTEDAHCSNDKACINTRCQNPCSTVSCGRNADCRAQLHRAVCTCRDGFTGNSQHACVEIGCRSDSDCAPIYSCINRECVDPCSYTSCGINAQCIADGNHKARCYCPETFRGNPLVQCDRPECTRDDECSYNLACRNEQCQNPCNCGQNAICNVISHRAQCSCPPGYIGNPLSSCQVEERAAQPQCKIDSECPSKLACFGGVCKNPCIETKPCGKNAECIVVDSLPLRTMSCMCLPGYVGDADVDCKLAPAPEEPGCKSHQDCAQSDTCINRQCLNACVIGHPCAPTAECEAAHHKALCKCPSPLIGDPLIRCYEQPLQPQPECVHDGECSGDKSCINQHCQDACLLSNPCGSNAECQTRQHRPTCVCPVGWIGNPQITCYKPECKIDDDCPYNKACISENCLNPCSTISCGRSAECIAQNHRAQCQCPAGTQGDPLLSCITGQCQYNEDCADHEACDRLNRICRPVCDSETCADSAQCLGQNHQPKCICPVGMVGNPFIECKLPAKPACTTDADCPSQLGCINQLCANPCHQGNLCSIEQECRVIDTVPLRTIMCACPSDQIIDDQGLCRPIVREQPQCQQDSDCSDTDKCYRGNCIDACRLDSCGVNAICTAAHHLTQCVCAPGYTGNPRLECTNVPRIPGILPQPECTIDDDCPLDSACKNNFCVNPCRSDKPCGKNAFCSVNRHQAVCRCPEGYIGRPEIECLAPPTAPAIGCTTNSECPLSEFCLNKLCISPCNCGPNADCRVDKHYATCFCKAGYSGNPQTGCFKLGCQSDNECGDDQQCYNSQCVNPCILDDPCARNAECFGRSHKANCRCSSGYSGDPFVRCERLECYSNQDCPSNRACIENRCIDPCSSIANPRCAQNAECYAQNHAAACVCPEHLPEGNPLAYCYATKVADKPLCVYDSDCPSKLACIRDQCVNPCISISPCHPTASCSVIDTTPVRTMACTCREGWVPNDNGECHAIVLPIPPGCSKDDDCPSNGACINRVCRNPCDCGVNAICDVRNHKPICSCKEGFEGNPNIFCRTIGCRIDSECDSGTACINGQCVSPCLVKNPCGTNAECFVNQNAPECKCRSGYRGNPYEKCLVIGCVSNSECPDDRQCINAQCINPCLYDNQCSSRAECLVQNHIALCKCPPGLLGNPYVDCKPESQPECREDGDCPALLACINSKCDNPCSVIQPCQNPAKCQVVNSLPVRTMNCVCPPGYISSGSGTCKPVTAITKAACISDSECPSDRACFNGICRNPCDCGPNAECRIKDHKPICACQPEYEGKPEIGCRSVGCRNDDECSPQHSCINRQCVPVCLPDNKPCGENATCYGNHHRAICDCLPGRIGNPRVACVLVGCRSDSECPSTTACINNECKDVCIAVNPCDKPATCKTFNHISECICPPGTVSDGSMGCLSPELPCTFDHDCQSGLACIGNTCQDTCVTTQPCGINANCKVVDTEPVRTMICECLPGYHGNAAVKCDKGIPAIPADCNRNKGYVINAVGECVCPPNTAPNNNDDCVPCRADKGLRIDERGRCVCALERGFIIDERGNCACHLEYGYRLDSRGNCVREKTSDCETNDDCPDHKYCNLETKTCDNPCATKRCGVYALCNATNHQAICQCITGYSGNPDKYCNGTQAFRTDFPKPDMLVSCLSDGVQVEIVINEQEGFNGVLYVKGHSKDEQCRRVLTLPANSASRTELFKVQFGNCGLIHVNGKASFVLVIQKHPKLVTYKAQAYHIQCVYQTGEQNVTLGFNVSMLTTAGTIANTGPPPTCLMKIVTPTGQEINSAEIGDSLILQVDVQPGSIYGGFARSCVAKTMEDAVENEYLVTDENGCATDPSIFGEWEYNPDTQSLLATFHAFKFPSSDNIRFQCNIRVCFGKCQPVNCRGSDAFGRRKRAVTLENDDDDPNNLLSGQLREEITIQSNAILTLERREERYTDTSLSPDAQRSEDICISMIGFIIALVITALLALVAVAVAVSCWLMAYRRRPKSTGPLPHPPEFPNPLFTTPEPMAEPRPDYLT